MSAYDPKVTPWMIKAEEMPAGDPARQLEYLLRYAILAPSSHNTQPWKFAIGREHIDVCVDRSRWLRIADADQRELYISAGCALENLIIAAEHFGFAPSVAYFPDPGDEARVAEVRLGRGGDTPAHHRHLFDCIPARATNHRAYDSRPIAPDALALLRGCVIERAVTLFTTTDARHKRQVDDLVIEADARQFADSRFRDELAHWIGEGVFGAPWLLAKLGQLAVKHVNLSEMFSDRDSEALLSAPALAVLTAPSADRWMAVQVGQVFERLHLLATYLGLSVQPMNQVLQVPELRPRLADVLPFGLGVPLFIFRMGYAEPEAAHTPRRPLEEMLT